MTASMRRHGWVYLMIIILGAALALGIAGVPYLGHDRPVRPLRTTTTTTVGATPTSGAG